jgi:hypothetical protein
MEDLICLLKALKLSELQPCHKDETAAEYKNNATLFFELQNCTFKSLMLFSYQ